MRLFRLGLNHQPGKLYPKHSTCFPQTKTTTVALWAGHHGSRQWDGTSYFVPASAPRYTDLSSKSKFHFTSWWTEGTQRKRASCEVVWGQMQKRNTFRNFSMKLDTTPVWMNPYFLISIRFFFLLLKRGRWHIKEGLARKSHEHFDFNLVGSETHFCLGRHPNL